MKTIAKVKKHLLVKKDGVYVFACDKDREFRSWADRWSVGGRVTCGNCKKIKDALVAKNHIQDGSWYEPLA